MERETGANTPFTVPSVLALVSSISISGEPDRDRKRFLSPLMSWDMSPMLLDWEPDANLERR